MDRRHTDSAAFAATALFALAASFAQTSDPMLPEDANDEQTMVPEDADDTAPAPTTAQPAATTPSPTPAPTATTETTPIPTVAPAPSAAPIRQAAAGDPPANASSMNVLVAAGDPSGSAIQNGCWVRLHANRNLSGEALTLVGPLDLAELRGPFGLDLEGGVHSLEVGPTATVTLFADERFVDETEPFQPGRRVPDIGEEFESLRIGCSRVPGG